MTLRNDEPDPHRQREIEELRHSVAKGLWWLAECFIVALGVVFQGMAQIVRFLVDAVVEILKFVAGVARVFVAAIQRHFARFTNGAVAILMALFQFAHDWIRSKTPRLQPEGADGGSGRPPPLEDLFGDGGDGGSGSPNLMEDLESAREARDHANRAVLTVNGEVREAVATAVECAKQAAEKVDRAILNGSLDHMATHGRVKYQRSNLEYYGEILKTDGDVIVCEARGYGVLRDDASVVHYRGAMVGDLPHGYGCQTTLDHRYEGKLRQGKRHGHGYLTQRGWTYIGEFQSGEMTGHGLWRSDHSTVEWKEHWGMFRNGSANGYGVRVYRDGRTYRGLFENGNPVAGRGRFS